jgi:hypothetical protein
MRDWFNRATSHLDRALVWIGAFGVLWAAMSWLGKHLSVFGNVPWPEAIFIGLGATLTVAFFTAAILALWRVFHPTPRGAVETPAASAPIYDDTGLRAEIQALWDQFAAYKAATDKIVSAYDGVRRKNVGDLGREIEGVKRDVEKCQEVQKSHRDQTLEAFHAIGARERMAALEAEIRRDAADLYDRLKAGETYDAAKWEQWENVHGHWLKTLDEWLGTGTWYALAVKERTLSVNDDKYGGSWTIADSQFPNAESVRRFKKFRIVQQQWEEVVPDVHTGMHQVAFMGMTEREVRRGRPAG